MIAGHGIDLVEIARIAEMLARFGERFREKTFTLAERTYCDSHRDPAPHYAARFAAKEAAAKALGCGIGAHCGWLEVEVNRDLEGAPTAHLSGTAAFRAAQKGIARVHLALSHSGGLAMASVILEKD